MVHKEVEGVHAGSNLFEQGRRFMNGYMQAEVLPEPTAPTIRTPV